MCYTEPRIQIALSERVEFMRQSFTSTLLVLYVFLVCFSFCLQDNRLFAQEATIFDIALQNGKQANEGFVRCNRYLFGWLAEADTMTGLIPRNLRAHQNFWPQQNFWNARDAAADNYSFMVLTCAAINPFMLETRMKTMLETERKLTSRIGYLPDTYSFATQGFLEPQPNEREIIFGSAEYTKDGLLPIAEFLGNSPWTDRLLEMLDDLIGLMNVSPELLHQRFGYIEAVETSGNMMQVLARMYWFTRNEKYLNKGIEFADYYLNEKNLLVNNPLRLRDHGCEIIGGLVEMYNVVKTVAPEKYQQWTPHIHTLLDTVLEMGRNEDGLFYNQIAPVSGRIIDSGLADTWGYTFNAVYTVYLLDGKPEYKEAVLKALKNIAKYRNYPWEGTSSDGYADSIESAINLYHFEPLPETADWIESEIQVMWAMQQPSGIIEGWHGDGNFARTTLMYCLWKTGGVIVENWNKNVIFGSVIEDGVLYLALASPVDWSGKIKLSPAFHRVHLNIPENYPRINQFQEWFPIDKDKEYQLIVNGVSETVKGIVLLDGYPVSAKGRADGKESLRIQIAPM